MNTRIKNGVTKSFGSIWKILKQKKKGDLKSGSFSHPACTLGLSLCRQLPCESEDTWRLGSPRCHVVYSGKPQPRVTSFRNCEKKASNSSCLFKWWETLKRLIGTPPFCWIQLCKLVGELKGKCEEGKEGRKGRFGNWRIAVVCGFCVWKIVLLQ